MTAEAVGRAGPRVRRRSLPLPARGEGRLGRRDRDVLGVEDMRAG